MQDVYTMYTVLLTAWLYKIKMRGYYLFYGIGFASYFFCFNVITALTLCTVDCNVEMKSEVVYTAFCIIWMACVIDIFSSPELYWFSHLSVCLFENL